MNEPLLWKAASPRHWETMTSDLWLALGLYRTLAMASLKTHKPISESISCERETIPLLSEHFILKQRLDVTHVRGRPRRAASPGSWWVWVRRAGCQTEAPRARLSSLPQSSACASPSPPWRPPAPALRSSGPWWRPAGRRGAGRTRLPGSWGSGRGSGGRCPLCGRSREPGPLRPGPRRWRPCEWWRWGSRWWLSSNQTCDRAAGRGKARWKRPAAPGRRRTHQKPWGLSTAGVHMAWRLVRGWMYGTHHIPAPACSGLAWGWMRRRAGPNYQAGKKRKKERDRFSLFYWWNNTQINWQLRRCCWNTSLKQEEVFTAAPEPAGGRWAAASLLPQGREPGQTLRWMCSQNSHSLRTQSARWAGPGSS